MIESGEKTEEYREIKPYWVKRLGGLDVFGFKNDSLIIEPKGVEFTRFDRVIFKNGYSKTARKMEFECNGILVGPGKFEWGALRNESYFVIKLGKCISK